MGSKAQGKASSAWAARAKKDGFPIRNSQACPVCYGVHSVPLKQTCNKSVAPRVGSQGFVSPSPKKFNRSLAQVVSVARENVDILSRKTAAQIDRQKDLPSRRPAGWNNAF